MGKFDGILIATDLDGTLLTDSKKVSDTDKSAIEYFMSEGGYFTICSGRSVMGVDSILGQITPNAPIITYNGAVIYDAKKKETLWETFLGEDSLEVIDFVENSFPFSGIEVCTDNGFAVSRSNARLKEQMKWENVPAIEIHHSKSPRPWRKVLFIQEADETDTVRNALASSPFAEKFNFMKSAPWYYEMLPENASKGLALLRVAEMLGIDKSRTVGAGDNENDLSLVELAGVGIGVKNASPEILSAADYITASDNNSSPMAEIIKSIENLEFKGLILNTNVT